MFVALTKWKFLDNFVGKMIEKTRFYLIKATKHYGKGTI